MDLMYQPLNYSIKSTQSQLTQLTVDVNKKPLAISNAESSITPSIPYSPVTPDITAVVPPSSPTKIDLITLPEDLKQNYSLENVLKHKGYMPLKCCTKTLQGWIYKLKRYEENDTTYIAKVTEKALHNKSIAYVEGYAINIYEDILKETAILRYLTSKEPPISLIKYIERFVDDLHYFLVLEDGGDPLFDFVKHSHQYITGNTMDIKEWHNFCKLSMNQMVDVLNWLHNTMGCCHLDVSLENWTIKNMHITMVMDPLSQVHHTIVLCSDFQIKLIDFGLSEMFRSENAGGEIDFQCAKYVGKTVYKAPKVYGKKHIFDARKADCWSLGVCFFMTFFGHPPFKKPSMKDKLFQLVMNGHLLSILDSWGLIDYVTVEILDLLMKIFRSEKHRLTIQQIKEHCFLCN